MQIEFSLKILLFAIGHIYFLWNAWKICHCIHIFTNFFKVINFGVVLQNHKMFIKFRCTLLQGINLKTFAITYTKYANGLVIISFITDELAEFSIDTFMEPTKCGPYQLGSWTNFQDGDTTHCHYQQTGARYFNITCQSNAIGQFVRIRLHSDLALVLCEVEVHGEEINPYIVLGKYR